MSTVNEGTVCIFGAGGPVGAAAAEWLKDHYTLRLTDLRDIADIHEPQNRRAPMPVNPDPPHEWVQVDVADYDQVLSATRGADAVVNATVLRQHPVEAFRVNMTGAYNVMKAAAAAGVKRVIHTGPRHLYLGMEGDYKYDADIPDEAPLCSGSSIYALTKQLGGEVCRVFAERHDIEVLVYLYCGFRPAEVLPQQQGHGVGPHTISWEDTGEAILYGLRAPEMPSNYEVFTMTADLPHGRYSSSKAHRLLGWRPRHNFEGLYRTPSETPAT
jgi:nucleoside-diphosphate-sugar epimerase